MSDQHSFLSAGNFYSDAYSRCQTAERMLNTPITRAEISRSFEEYLEIFDEFYADDIELSSETRQDQFVERQACAHFSSTSWSHFMYWPKSVACRYRWPADVR